MASEPRNAPIAGRFVPDPDRPAAHLAPELRGVQAREPGRDWPDGLVALRVLPASPPRAGAILALAQETIPRLLQPLAHGVAGGAAWVVCPAPPGPAISVDAGPWSEQALLSQLMRPAAAVLDALAKLGLTHRAIRPDNLFREATGEVVLGPAWAEPPASLQPALFESPESQCCVPAGRGNGDIADDVYALGVVMLCLALGRMPLEGLDDAAILRRKVELGSYDALVGQGEVSPMLAALLRTMLADDPQLRPAPALLRESAATRPKRLAPRTLRPAERGLVVGSMQAWSVRGLALALSLNPAPAVALVRGGAAAAWLRRSLGDNPAATRLEAALVGIERLPDPVAVMRAVAVLNPLAPLCWRGMSLWPDGIGPMLAQARQDPATLAALHELVASESVLAWARLRPQRSNLDQLRVMTRNQRVLLGPVASGGAAPPTAGVRLLYELNPLLPCASPMLGRRVVVGLADMLAALESLAREWAGGGAQGAVAPRGGTEEAGGSALPIDAEMMAFALARQAQRPDDAVVSGAVMRQAHLLGLLQERMHSGPLPGLAGWLLRSGLSDLSAWHNKETRERLAARLAELAGQGLLSEMVALLTDKAAIDEDEAGVELALSEAARIDEKLDALATRQDNRLDQAYRNGRDLVGSLGLMLAAGFLMQAVLS